MYPFRFKMILIIICILFIGLVVRLYQLQIQECDNYRGISKNRRISSYPLEAARGSIYDRNGKTLAMDHHSFDASVQYKSLLYCHIVYNHATIPRINEIPAHKKTTKACIECHEKQDVWLKKICKILGAPQSALLERTKQIVEKVERLKQNVEQKTGRPTRVKEEMDYHSLISDIPWEKVVQIETQQDTSSGIRIIPRPERIYPEQKLASHVLGYLGRLNEKEWKEQSSKWNNFILHSCFTGSDTASFLYDGYAENDLIGRSGVEAYFEEELKGMRGKRFEETVCKNTQIEKVILERPPVAGNNLYLTIDSQIQASTEKALGKNFGAIIVMDPWTGEILSMASSPRFNPNTVNEDFNKLNKQHLKPFMNRAIQGALPPGSTFKVITAMAALSTGRISNATSIDCRGHTNYHEIQFKCWLDSGHGPTTIEDALPYSCNVFFFDTAKILGGDLLYTWAKKFCVGDKTGIDIVHERGGNIPKLKNTATAMNVAIGQGALLTTPLQMVRVYAAIANGGSLVQPHVLLKITNGDGETIRTGVPGNVPKLSLQPAMLYTIRTALHEVITRGTAKHTGLDLYKVAGKTGTAETGRAKDNHAWFIGYAPYDNPKYCFAILIEHTPGHGAEIAGPIARELLADLFPEIEQSS